MPFLSLYRKAVTPQSPGSTRITAKPWRAAHPGSMLRVPPIGRALRAPSARPVDETATHRMPPSSDHPFPPHRLTVGKSSSLSSPLPIEPQSRFENAALVHFWLWGAIQPLKMANHHLGGGASASSAGAFAVTVGRPVRPARHRPTCWPRERRRARRPRTTPECGRPCVRSGASSAQRVFMLNRPCSAIHAFASPTPLAIVLDMCQ